MLLASWISCQCFIIRAKPRLGFTLVLSHKGHMKTSYSVPSSSVLYMLQVLYRHCSQIQRHNNFILWNKGIKLLPSCYRQKDWEWLIKLIFAGQHWPLQCGRSVFLWSGNEIFRYYFNSFQASVIRFEFPYLNVSAGLLKDSVSEGLWDLTAVVLKSSHFWDVASELLWKLTDVSADLQRILRRYVPEGTTLRLRNFYP